MIMARPNECFFGPDHCFHLWPNSGRYALSIYLYLFGAAFAFYTGIARSLMFETGHATLLEPVRRTRWIPTLLFFSFLLRALWFTLVDIHAFESKEGPASFHHVRVRLPFDLWPQPIDLYPLVVTFPGKMATLSYFSVFTILIRFWDDLLVRIRVAGVTMIDKNLAVIHDLDKSKAQKHHHRHHRHSHPREPRRYRRRTTTSHPSSLTGGTQEAADQRSRMMFVMVNIWMVLIEVAILVIRTFFPETRAFIFQIDTVVVALFFLALALIMVKCTYQLYSIHQQYIQFSVYAHRIQRRLIFLACVCCGLFFFRAILTVFTAPSSSSSSSALAIVNPWLLYTMTELPPGLCLLVLMQRQKRKQQSRPQEQYHAHRRESGWSSGVPNVFRFRTSQPLLSCANTSSLSSSSCSSSKHHRPRKFSIGSNNSFHNYGSGERSVSSFFEFFRAEDHPPNHARSTSSSNSIDEHPFHPEAHWMV